MNLLSLFMIALGLSMDATAVSLTNGMCYKNSNKKIAFYTAIAFGLFQGLMPTVGYFAGQAFAGVVQKYEHWIAFVLLGIIGGKMIYEAVDDINKHSNNECRLFSFKLLFFQAIATSIDALAIGVAYVAMSVNIFYAALLICIVTFICSLIGYEIGRKFGAALQSKAEIFGGLILIGIGVKIFIEHTIA